jgi:lipopolysaccharide assembly outer membrane protein LptD (OstA)
MKLLMLSAVMACQFFAFASQGVCQEAKPQPDRPYLMHTKAPRLHFLIPPTESTGRVELTASSAERDLSAQRNTSSTENEAVLQLRGNVEVMMCSPGGHGCDNGAMVLHADMVDYNEETHEIEAHGDVHIDPYRSRPQNTIIPR